MRRLFPAMIACAVAMPAFAQESTKAGAAPEVKISEVIRAKPDPKPATKVRTGPVVTGVDPRMERIEAQLKAQAQDEEALVVNVRPAFSDENFNQWVFRGSGNAQLARNRIDSMLAAKTEEVDRVCGLSDAQKKKLQLAGRGDIKRFFDRVEESRKKFQLVKNDPSKLREILQEIQPLQSSLNTGLFGDNSIFAKTVRTTLSAEQLDRYDQIDRHRRTSRHLTKIEMALSTFDNAVRLRGDQRQKLVEFMLRETRPPRRTSPNDHYVVLIQMARLPDEKLKPFFDDSQWRILRQMLDQLKGMEQQLKQAGVLVDDDFDQNEDEPANLGQKRE